MHGSAGSSLVRGDLCKRPVAAQIQVDHLALVLGKEGAVSLVEGKRAPTRLQGVKGHSLTVYQYLDYAPMEDIWRDSLLYNKWANLELLGACDALTQEQLELTTPGAYGTIADTFVHLLAAEQRYIKRLAGAPTAISEKDGFPGIEALKGHASRNGDALIAAAAGLQEEEMTETDYEGFHIKLRKSLVVVQAIHHGNDHRTQIGGILEAHSLEHPNIDVWMYGRALQC